MKAQRSSSVKHATCAVRDVDGEGVLEATGLLSSSI